VDERPSDEPSRARVATGAADRLGTTFGTWVLAAVVLGTGTAMAHPRLSAAIVDVARPAWPNEIGGAHARPDAPVR
jgi:hypothetical protein